MPVLTFDLTTNPFYQLGVSARDGLDRIADAAEEAESSGRLSAQAARDARRQLATSRSRLDAELRWLPGVHPDAVTLVVKTLADRRLARAREILPQLPGLARANVASHLCCCDQESNPPLHHMLDAQNLILAHDIEQRVNNERGAAGLPLVTRDLVTAGLNDIVDLHARATVQALLRGQDGADTLAAILRDNQDDRGGARVLLERTVDQFESTTAGRIHTIEEQIDAAAQTVRANPKDTTALENVKAGIALWARLTMPRRLISSRIGVDDKRSSDFVKRQRELCLSLANDHRQHATALDLTRLLAARFADQKSMVATLADDASVLAENVAADQSRAVLDPLENAIAAARRNMPGTIINLDNAGFGEGSTGTVYDMFRAFAAAVSPPLSSGDVPWLMVRSLAIDINNEQHRPGAALNLVEGLLRHRPPAPRQVLDKLHQDRAVLSREAGLLRAEAGIAGGRLLEARQIVQRLIEEEKDQSERHKLRDLLRGIEAREAQNSRRWKVRAGWIIAGIAFIIWLASQDGRSPRTPAYPPVPSYTHLRPLTPLPTPHRLTPRLQAHLSAQRRCHRCRQANVSIATRSDGANSRTSDWRLRGRG